MLRLLSVFSKRYGQKVTVQLLLRVQRPDTSRSKTGAGTELDTCVPASREKRSASDTAVFHVLHFVGAFPLCIPLFTVAATRHAWQPLGFRGVQFT